MKEEVFIALLRGVNVGGRNKLPMKQLGAIIEELGGKAVETYIQSGNVIFRDAADRQDLLPDLIARAIAEQAGVKTSVVLRSFGALRRVVAANPYLATGCDEGELHVAFLARRPGPEEIATLDPERSPPDEFTVRGSEIYLRFPNGVARSKLTNAYFDARLKTIATVRNWKTTRKLLELAPNSRATRPG